MPRIKQKRKVNPKEQIVSRAHPINERVYGCRFPDAYIGTFVRAYVTINENNSGRYRNPAYVVKCDIDGKERVFQSICSIQADNNSAISVTKKFNVR